jgi:CO/xanthine dehydrogenase Mo-binding subunit
MTNLKMIGKRVPPIDAREKAMGNAVFGADVVLPKMLHAAVLRSPHAHARIVAIDATAAEKLPGVRLVATGRNTPAKMFGAMINDERFFASDEALFVGDAVAAAVAVDRETARAALDLIKVEYEPLPAVLDMAAALEPGSPLTRQDFKSNVAHHVELSRGDMEQGWREAAVIHEETFSLPYQHQAYLETQVCTAAWERGRVTIWAPSHAPRGMAVVVQKAFDLPDGTVRYHQTYVGGGFGAKTYMFICVQTALLAKMAGVPVQLVYDREEDFQVTTPRIPMLITVKMGAAADGRITAKDTRIIADNGAASLYAPTIVDTTSTRVDTLYRFKNLHVVTDLVYTNKIPTSAFRGFGNPQAHFAVESMMDILAEKLGMDPVDIRLKNATQPGDVSAHGWIVHSCGLSETIERARMEIDWDKKRVPAEGKKRGVGLACGLHVSGNRAIAPTGDGSYAQVKVFEDGTVHIASSEAECGQGSKTVFALIAAEELGVPYDKIFVEPVDTDVTSFGVGAVASRVTVLGGNAVKAGALAAKKRLEEAAAWHWGCDPSGVTLQEGQLINLKTESAMPIAEAATHYVGMTGGSRLIGEGFFRADGVVVPDKTKYGNISLAYAFATQAAEVEVDTETGEIKVLRLIGVHDSGKILNPTGFEGQIEGGLVQGMGYALIEDYYFKDGRVMNPNYTDYRIPTSLDIPDLKVLSVETQDPNGPYGAKSVGEMAMVPTAPAIANALYNAVGIRMTELPMTPERVLKALKAKSESR